MRTTINLDDDVLTAVKQYAESRSVALGKAVSDLVRRGITASRPTRLKNGLHIVELPPDSPVITLEKIREADDEI
jgi:Arc/MetJ family transcription regulator